VLEREWIDELARGRDLRLIPEVTRRRGAEPVVRVAGRELGQLLGEKSIGRRRERAADAVRGLRLSEEPIDGDEFRWGGH
jgi:hypothetical protein